MDIQVVNLSVHVMESDIEKMFSVYGDVLSVTIKRNEANGRSTGNAFVRMRNDEEAQMAIKGLNQTVVDGKRIAVMEVKYGLGKYNN